MKRPYPFGKDKVNFRRTKKQFYWLFLQKKKKSFPKDSRKVRIFSLAISSLIH